MAQDFFNKGDLPKRIRGMVGTNQNRFNINIDELRQANDRLANFVVRNPVEAIKIFEDQLNTTVRGFQEDSGKQNNEKMAQAADTYFPQKV